MSQEIFSNPMIYENYCVCNLIASLIFPLGDFHIKNNIWSAIILYLSTSACRDEGGQYWQLLSPTQWDEFMELSEIASKINVGWWYRTYITYGYKYTKKQKKIETKDNTKNQHPAENPRWVAESNLIAPMWYLAQALHTVWILGVAVSGGLN